MLVEVEVAALVLVLHSRDAARRPLIPAPIMQTRICFGVGGEGACGEWAIDIVGSGCRY